MSAAVAESLYSPNWYRIAPLKPRLRNHVRAERQVYRGQTWYLLRDGSSGRHHRINAIGYQFAGRLDGRKSVEQIADLLGQELGERSPTQDEIIQILIQLSQLELIQGEGGAEFDELFRRRDERERKRRRADVNPLSFRVRLFDPSPVLDRWSGAARMFFTRTFLFLWLAVLVLALLAVQSNWDVLAEHARSHMLTPRFLLLTWLCYPIIKLVHEFAHAFAVRVRGGEVREMGVRVLFLTPVPYVDAGAANGFRNKWQRITVSAAGIMAEVLLAAFALFIWLNVEQGWVRDVAFVVMAIGGVSTVLFNGNPLLRFDGYYILADLFDLPNLGQRSSAYWAYLAQRYLCRFAGARSPATTWGERVWLLGYGAASLAYRWFVSFVILLWVSAKSLALALPLAAWFCFSLLAKPIVAMLRFLLLAPQLARQRARALALSATFALLAVAVIGLVPAPSSTLAPGVVWLPEQAKVRPQTEGFVKAILIPDGAQVQAGDVIAELEAPELLVRRTELEAKLQSVEAQYQKALGEDPGEAAAFEQARDQARAELAHIEERAGALQVRSPVGGALVLPYQDDKLGAYMKRGSVLAHVVSPASVEVRVAVAGERAALVRERHRRVDVYMLESGLAHRASLVREVPAATHTLPSAALSDRAGGAIATDPQDAEALRTLRPVFLFDVELPAQRVDRVGARVWVRFDHGREPLARQWARSLRQLVLRHFSVAS